MITELYLNQKVAVLATALTDWVLQGKGFRQGCCLSPTVFNNKTEYMIKDEFEDREEVQEGLRYGT